MTPAPRRADGRLTVALVSEVYWQPDGLARLDERLEEAGRRGADLALLPELPLNAWQLHLTEARDEDAEPMDGPRAQALAGAARRARVGLVGGIIHRGPDGRRTNRALVFNAQGELAASYDKVHLPAEPGFWETSHYQPGTAMARPIGAFGMPVGIQVCSDTNRPQGSLALSAQGAEAILIPRATEERTYQRWKVVFRAIALTSATYVLSVARPDPEQGVLLGGPSVAIDPAGFAMVETTDRLELVTLERSVVGQARAEYPGYLPVRADLYATAWSEVAESASRPGGPGDTTEPEPATRSG